MISRSQPTYNLSHRDIKLSNRFHKILNVQHPHCRVCTRSRKKGIGGSNRLLPSNAIRNQFTYLSELEGGIPVGYVAFELREPIDADAVFGDDKGGSAVDARILLASITAGELGI
jgi:hypothetical protein